MAGCSFNTARAERAQRLLARRVMLRDEFPPLKRVAGLDVSYLRTGDGEVGVGVAVLLDYPSLRPRECVVYVDRVCVPYIPGFLAFREMAVAAPALARLSGFDLVIVDGHGIAHPRRFGIASHVGVVFGKPSIGVAKRRLAGLEADDGGKTYIILGGEKVGVVIRRGRSRLYVSPGNKVSVDTAGRLVESMLKAGRRLPEPTRVADEVSKAVKHSLRGEGGAPTWCRFEGRLSPQLVHQ